MKKEIMLTLAISMAVLPSATAAFAAQDTDAKQVSESKFVTLAQSQPLEISGKVDKISEGELTVSTKDGKVYQVPLWKLSKIEGFSELGLKVGTEVSFKSTQPDFANVKLGNISSSTPLDIKGTVIEGKTLTFAEGKLAPLSSVDASKILKAVPIFTAAPNIEAKGHVDLKETSNIATLTAVEGFVPDFSKVQAGTLKIAENAKAINLTSIAPADGSFTLSALDKGVEIFIAGEITANGKTLKLNN